MGLYFKIAGTPKDLKVDNILFLRGNEASERWETLKDKVVDKTKADQVCKAFSKSFVKLSSYWQSRDKYFSGIKTNQITAELDICMKEVVRKHQFKTNEVELTIAMRESPLW